MARPTGPNRIVSPGQTGTPANPDRGGRGNQNYGPPSPVTNPLGYRLVGGWAPGWAQSGLPSADSPTPGYVDVEIGGGLTAGRS
jgi:hypothetical protein